MNELPELPFEELLSYLGLADRLRLSAVSRSCHQKIANSRVKTLCYSKLPRDFILGKGRWVSGEFARNFISSTRFESFFEAFGQTVLSSLKHLRLCDLSLDLQNRTAFSGILNSFDQLEELNIVRVQCRPEQEVKLNLPMLTSIHLEQLKRVKKLTVDASRLREIKLLACSDLRVEIVHGESVERLLVEWFGFTEVKNLKNLQFLYFNYPSEADPTLLSSLKQLKEFHTNSDKNVSELFEQKRRYDRADLKIYLAGLLLNGPDDLAFNVLRGAFPGFLSPESFGCLAKNPFRLADEIRLYRFLCYSAIALVAPGLEFKVLKRFTDLKVIKVDMPVHDIQRFLDLLKNFENIVELEFLWDPPQDLFDRLPEHCAVQKLSIIDHPSPNLAFLFRLKHLIRLKLGWSIDTDTVRKAFEEISFLCLFEFWSFTQWATIEHRKQFRVSIGSNKNTVSDLNAAIEFIVANEKKRKADELE